jgi:hypothetical protein
MTEAKPRIAWVWLREVVTPVARHLGCTPEQAQRRIVSEAPWIKAWGLTVEKWEVSPLSVMWSRTIDWDAGSLSGEITNVGLCFIDLIAAGLLPPPTERARIPAEEAIAYLVKGVPLPWKEWQGAGASGAEIEQAQIDLSEAIGAGVPAWGRPSPFERERQIPADDFHADMIDERASWWRLAKRPSAKVIVHIDGTVGTSQRYAKYKGPPWSAIKVDSAGLKQAHPRPPRARTEEMEPAGIAGASQSAAEARIETAKASPPDHTAPVEPVTAEAAEAPETQERTRRGRKTGQSPATARAMCELAEEILADDSLRPSKLDRVITIARILTHDAERDGRGKFRKYKQRGKFKGYADGTAAKYISPVVRDWERENPDK